MNFNRFHKRRLGIICFFAIVISVGVALILFALKQNINLFLTPSQITTAHITTNDHFRLGGMVKPRSVIRIGDTLAMSFVITDLKQERLVKYQGSPPDLFREGKGVIAEGHIDNNGVFIASTILAKHDENYTPKQMQNLIGKA